MWYLYRQDINDNIFLMDKFSDKDKAERQAEKFIKRGHHQTYWVENVLRDDIVC